MFQTFFGEVTEGELHRLPYLGYSVLLTLFTVGVVVLLVLGLVGAGGLGGGAGADAGAMLETLGLPVVLGLVGVALLAAFGSANLSAKRVRDIGLPGWTTVIGFSLATAALSLAVSEPMASGIRLLGWVALLVLPSHALRSA